MRFLSLVTCIALTASIAHSQNYEGGELSSKIIKGKTFLVISEKTQRQHTFDSVKIHRYFAFCYSGKNISIYSQATKQLVASNIRAYHKLSLFHSNYQLLKANKVIWLNINGEMLEKNPNEKVNREICGTVLSFEQRLFKQRDSSFLKIITKDVPGEVIRDITLNLTPLFGSNYISFLNNSRELLYDENTEFDKELDNLTFLERTADGKQNIVRLDTTGQAVAKIILLNAIDSRYGINNKANFKEFQPFIFMQNNLYGYYPMNKKARYQFLNPINQCFARFMLTDGRKGWLAVDGKEYLD